MTISPIWLQNLAYSAQLDRNLIEALVGIEGVSSPLSMKVKPTSPGSMRVKVSAGGVFIKGDNTPGQGMYYVVSDDEIETSSISPPASGYKRTDLICVSVKDPDASGPAGDSAQIEIVTGNPTLTGAPADIPTAPATHYVLAHLNITSSTVSIGTGEISDQRALCGGVEHIGSIKPWAGSTSSVFPNGWYPCNGAALSRTDFAELFEVIGTTYGAGNGSTTFNIPNLLGRAPVGSGTGDYAGASARALGQKGGAETVTLSPQQIPLHSHSINHTHQQASTSTQPAHTHTPHTQNRDFIISAASGDPGPAGGLSLSAGGRVNAHTGAAGAHSHTVNIPAFSGQSGSAGGGQGHENMMPFLVVTYLIRII